MGRNTNSHRIVRIFTYIMVLLASMDIFRYYFTLYLRGISFYAVLAIIVFIVFSNYKNIKLTRLHHKQKMFFTIWAFIYIIVNQIFANYKYSNIVMGIDFNIFTIQTIQVICVVIAYSFIDTLKDINLKVNIIKIILFSLVIDAITTLLALTIDPNISKIMATASANSNLEGLKGVSGYSIIYSLVIIVPMLLYSIKELKTKSRLFLQLFTLLMMYFIFKSAYATALIALVLGIVVYLFLNTSKIFKVLLLPFILYLAVILINPNSIYDILIYLSDKIEIHQISIRFNQLADLILYGDNSGDALYRLVLYRQSIDAFMQYPLTGIIIYNPNYALSGHSAFLDILGGIGLLGFIPYVLFLWYSYKISINKTEHRKLKNAIRTSYIVFCFIGSINTLATSLTIMLFLLFFVSWYPVFVEDIKFKQNNGNIKLSL